ncbi:Pam3-gp28 family putative phage holin [Devosia sp. A369]
MNAIFSRIFTAPFLITILRYGLAAAGAWLVARGLIDEGTWEVVGGAILTIIVALLGR